MKHIVTKVTRTVTADKVVKVLGITNTFEEATKLMDLSREYMTESSSELKKVKFHTTDECGNLVAYIVKFCKY